MLYMIGIPAFVFFTFGVINLFHPDPGAGMEKGLWMTIVGLILWLVFSQVAKHTDGDGGTGVIFFTGNVVVVILMLLIDWIIQGVFGGWEDFIIIVLTLVIGGWVVCRVLSWPSRTL